MSLGKEIAKAVLDDPERAPIDERLRATLRLLRTLTLEPDRVDAAAVRAAHAAGVSDEAIRDAIRVCALFNTIDRVADAVQFHVRSADEFARDAVTLLKRGYRM